jgi:glycosyltransferase involved in cell wall biosynthesis
MRIGIASLGRVSEDTGGKNYILHFFRELERLHSQHEFVLFLSENEAAPLGLHESSSMRIVTIPNSKQTPLHKVIGEQLLLPKCITREKIDVMYYPGNFVSLRSKVPAVVNIRATAHFYGNQYGIHGVRRLIRSLLMPPSARKAKAVITPSEDIKKDVIRFTKTIADKIQVIPHGVDLHLFDGDANRSDPKGKEILDRYDLSPNNYLLYASALWRYKNQDKLIRAHAEIVKAGYPDLKLVLAGKGTGTEQKYLEEIHQLPKQLGTEHLVVFTGGLPQNELRYLYAHAKAFVFPSSYESFGNPIFESWASGVPVAAANVHSFPEIIGEAGLLFNPSDQTDMTDKILKLLKDEDLRATLIHRGRERAKQFTWEQCVTRTLSLLERVK